MPPTPSHSVAENKEIDFLILTKKALRQAMERKYNTKQYDTTKSELNAKPAIVAKPPQSPESLEFAFHKTLPKHLPALDIEEQIRKAAHEFGGGGGGRLTKFWTDTGDVKLEFHHPPGAVRIKPPAHRQSISDLFDTIQAPPEFASDTMIRKRPPPVPKKKRSFSSSDSPKMTKKTPGLPTGSTARPVPGCVSKSSKFPDDVLLQSLPSSVLDNESIQQTSGAGKKSHFLPGNRSPFGNSFKSPLANDIGTNNTGHASFDRHQVVSRWGPLNKSDAEGNALQHNRLSANSLHQIMENSQSLSPPPEFGEAEDSRPDYIPPPLEFLRLDKAVTDSSSTDAEPDYATMARSPPSVLPKSTNELNSFDVADPFECCETPRTNKSPQSLQFKFNNSVLMQERCFPATNLTAVNETSQTKSVQTWSQGDVVNWLNRQRLGQYSRRFQDGGIDGARLVSLTRDGLIALGVTSVADRRNIERAVLKLTTM